MRLSVLVLIVFGFGCLAACGSPEQVAYPPPQPRAVTIPDPSAVNVVAALGTPAATPGIRFPPCEEPTPQPNGTRYPATSTIEIRPGYPPPTPVDTPTPCPTPITNPAGPRALTIITPTFNFNGNPGGYRPPRVALQPNAILRFFDAANGIGISWGSRLSEVREPPVLLKTADGGRSWNKGSRLDDQCTDYGLQFVDSQHGWGIGKTGPVAHGGYILCQTVDGGQTWMQIRKLDGFAYGVSMAFVDQRIGYFEGSGELWMTRDGGLTIEKVGRFPWNAGSLDFISADVGAYIDNHRLYRTTDGGASWTPIPLGYLVLTIDLVSEDNAWIRAEDCNGKRCKPLLLSTNDGGQSWTGFATNDDSYASPTTWFGYERMSFADPEHGWLFSEDRLWSTDDGGQSWTEIYEPTQ